MRRSKPFWETAKEREKRRGDSRGATQGATGGDSRGATRGTARDAQLEGAQPPKQPQGALEGDVEGEIATAAAEADDVPLLESWVWKQSKWLRWWRRRWLVLTPRELLSHTRQDGMARGDTPTERFAISQLGVVRPQYGAKLLVATGERLLLLDLSIANSGADETHYRANCGERMRDVWTTELVNARLRSRVGDGVERVSTADEGKLGLVGCEERFEIGRLLGVGGFASVYRGRSLRSGASCAIKRVALAGQGQAMVEREAAVLRLVQGHPHVVRLLGCFADNRTIGYLVLELLPGGDLFGQLVERYANAGGGYTEADVRAIMAMAFSALAFLHARRVAHRDLKPENVLLLDRRGGLLDLRICDFGQAVHVAEGAPLPTSRVGTRAYMAPEVASEVGHSFPADLWSLGVLLFTLLSGEPPFGDETTTEGGACRGGACRGEGGAHAPSAPRAAHARAAISADGRTGGGANGLASTPTIKEPPLAAATDPTNSPPCAPPPPPAPLHFDGACWDAVSSTGKELVRRLLQLSPSARPTPADVLCGAWLAPTPQSQRGLRRRGSLSHVPGLLARGVSIPREQGGVWGGGGGGGSGGEAPCGACLVPTRRPCCVTALAGSHRRLRRRPLRSGSPIESPTR